MKLLIKLIQNTKIAHVVRKNRFLKFVVKSIYKIIMFPFTRGGVDISIGGAGYYKLDYNFALSGYESFGDRHNAGFHKWIQACKDKTTVFDIGAHIGLYTIPASRAIAQNGFVYAFEPSEANRRYLKRHLEYNKIYNVVLLPYIVGEATKESQVFYENKNVDPMSSLHPKKNINRYSRMRKKQISLDDFSEKFDTTPNVIKIDVEGCEYNVLKGASGIIRKYRPVIFLSVHPNQLNLFGSSIKELKEIIASFRYTAWNWDETEAEKFERKEYMLRPA